MDKSNTRIRPDLKTRITRLLTACTRARNPHRFCTRAYVRVQRLSRRQPHLYHLSLAIQFHRSVLAARADTTEGASVRLNNATRQRDHYLEFYGFPHSWNRK